MQARLSALRSSLFALCSSPLAPRFFPRGPHAAPGLRVSADRTKHQAPRTRSLSTPFCPTLTRRRANRTLRLHALSLSLPLPRCPLPTPLQRRLDLYDNSDYRPGAGIGLRTLWYFVSLVVFESGWFPVSKLKTAILRAFGARIGTGVVIKPHVRIKYPWNLTVGDHVWIGEEAWIDNLAQVTLGSHSVISQGAYLCTGSHDHRSPTFDLITKPITIGEGAWICARAIILPGVTLEPNQIVPAGQTARK